MSWMSFFYRPYYFAAESRQIDQAEEFVAR